MSRSVKGGAAVACRSCQTLGASQMRSVSSSRCPAAVAASPCVAFGLGRPSAGDRRTSGLARDRTQAAARATVVGMDRTCFCTASSGSVSALLGGLVARAHTRQVSLVKVRASSCRAVQRRCLGFEMQRSVHTTVCTFAWRRAAQARFIATALPSLAKPNLTLHRTAFGSR